MYLNKTLKILLLFGFSSSISVLVQYIFLKASDFCSNKSQPKLHVSGPFYSDVKSRTHEPINSV